MRRSESSLDLSGSKLYPGLVCAMLGFVACAARETEALASQALNTYAHTVLVYIASRRMERARPHIRTPHTRLIRVIL